MYNSLKKTNKQKSSFEDTISTTALTLNILHSQVNGDILHIMPQSYSTEIVRLNLQFIHCIFFTLRALMYCTVHFIQSFAAFSFQVWTSIYPQIPDFKSFIEKNRSAWLKHLTLDTSMPQSSLWDLLETLQLREDSWPPPSARRAPLQNSLTHLASEHRSVYKTAHSVLCINFT